MASSRRQPKPSKARKISPATEAEVVSLEECKRYVGSYGLSDKRILEIRNSLIGIVDSLVSSYLADFKE